MNLTPRIVAASALLSAAALFAAGPAAAGPYQDAVLATGPLAYWPLDEASGVVVDATGNGHDGFPEGNPGYGAPSLLPSGEGSAVALDQGHRFFVNAFEKWSAGSSGYTAEYWIQVNQVRGYFTQVFGDGVASGTFYMMQYLENAGSGYACPRPHYGANNGNWAPSPCTVQAFLSPGVPHHVVVTWDRPTGVVHVWIDGVEFIQTNKPTGVPADTALPMWIGHDNRELGWDIVIDEPAFWDRPLTPEEIQSHAVAATLPGCTDSDGDSICDDTDACFGDNATGDSDSDGVCDSDDVCAGDDATGDTDSDGVCDSADNCPDDVNPGQGDADGDTIGDVCEADSDADGTIDDLDNCPADANPDQADSEGDGVGDVCDPDDDNDGTNDDTDNCPLIANADQADFDGDGQGDVCDGDDDADGVADEADQCPGTPLDVLFDEAGCSGQQQVNLNCNDNDPCAFPNHGQYQSCVVHAANAARDSGLLTNKERSAIVRAASKNHCGQ